MSGKSKISEVLWFALSFVILGAGCGGSTQNSCAVTASITPASVSASLAPPGNQVQFTMQSSVAGNCPLIPDFLGAWATSDAANTSINQQGLATCVNATTTPATISNSSTVRGKLFTPATLMCR